MQGQKFALLDLMGNEFYAGLTCLLVRTKNTKKGRCALPFLCGSVLAKQLWKYLAIQDLKVRKVAGPSGVTAEMIKAAGEQAVDWLTSICNRIVKEEVIPESWQMSELVPIYKGKGDMLECSLSQGIKLLEHGMKVAERVLERRLRQAVEIDKMQFGFRPGTGTSDAIFIARQLQERYRGKTQGTVVGICRP